MVSLATAAVHVRAFFSSLNMCSRGTAHTDASVVTVCDDNALLSGK